MLCKHKKNITCDIFNNINDCWYENYEQCRLFKKLRDR